MAKLESMFEDMKVKKPELHPKRVTKWIHYTKLKDNEKQYRQGKTEEEQARSRKRAEQLADLIDADGEVLQDLLVRKTDTDEYEIIAGHHRAMACRILVEEQGKEQYAFLPCIVRNTSDARAEFALYSTNGYDNKTDYEIMCELEGMKHLLETYPEEFPGLQHGRMVERLAKQMHMKRSTVGEYQAIANNLGQAGMDRFRSGELKKSAAVQLSSLQEEEQEQLVQAGITTHKEITEYKSRKERQPEGDVPKFGTFPVLKNMEERERFINAYKKWRVWCRNTCTEETFYRYDLPEGAAIVVKEYPYTDYWDPQEEHVGQDYYLLEKDTKHFKNGKSSITEITEYLKDMQKHDGRNRQEGGES